MAWVNYYGGKAYPQTGPQPTSWQGAATTQPLPPPTTFPSGQPVGGYTAPPNPASLPQPLQISQNMGMAPTQPTPASAMAQGGVNGGATTWAQAVRRAAGPSAAPMSYGAGSMANPYAQQTYQSVGVQPGPQPRPFESIAPGRYTGMTNTQAQASMRKPTQRFVNPYYGGQGEV